MKTGIKVSAVVAMLLTVAGVSGWHKVMAPTQDWSWPDHRIIGTVYLASSAQGDKTAPAGFANNPRRYFTDSNSDDFDLRNEAGTKRFQERVLRQAEDAVTNLTRMHAQGVITWDIEGEQYPQDTSYVCSPDQIAELAPEMETIIQEGRYAGLKLDDAYFKTLRDGGFRVGVCVRPQHLTLGKNGRAEQISLSQDEVAAELIRKMKYAHDRWGATIFYADSTVKADGRTLDAELLEAAAAAIPGSLFIPEESTVRMYASMAPFQTFLFHGDTGTPLMVRALYPRAFSANLVNDVAPEKIAEHRAELIESIKQGDILMIHAGYWQVNNDAVLALYRAAGREP